MLTILLCAHALAIDAGLPWGDLPLVDEVDLASPTDHSFVESATGVSEVQTLLGQEARVLPNTGGPRYVAVKLGEGKALEAGSTYLLQVEYPQDAARTVYVINRGSETARGFSTGVALGDALHNYTNPNAESLDYPLTGAWETWSTPFALHERSAGLTKPSGAGERPDTPEDGFWVLFAQPGQWEVGGSTERQAPLSTGLAVGKVRLFEIPDPQSHFVDLHLPPDDLPHRHLFWREEMSDGVISASSTNQPGLSQEDWYAHKLDLMGLLGMNTFSKDLLEFGANQGWDSSGHGGNDWIYQSSSPDRWATIVGLAAERGIGLLPYYEYAGSKGDHGLGFERRAEPLWRDPYTDGGACQGYTHVWWSEVANVDLTDPDTLEDLDMIFDLTVAAFADQARFEGVWLRVRPSDLPISFSEAARERYAVDRGEATAPSRQDLLDSASLYEDYLDWWLDQRRAFLESVRDRVREDAGQDAITLFTAYSGEPGPSVSGGVVADDPSRLEEVGVNAQDWQGFVDGDGFEEAALGAPSTWSDGSCSGAHTDYEWAHSVPRPDPDAWADVEGVALTYPFNRLYTADAELMARFTGPSGLAAVRHYSLNENTLTSSSQGELAGYFVTDVDRAGPFVVMAEARALAEGDPRFLGYLTAESFSRGDVEWVRRFDRAFLSLPAVPSTRTDTAEGLVLRHYPTESHGDWVAIINPSFETVSATVALPASGALTDAGTGEALGTGEDVAVELAPAEVLAVHIRSEPGESGDDEDEGGCGCATPGAAGGWLLVLLPVLRARRRRTWSASFEKQGPTSFGWWIVDGRW